MARQIQRMFGIFAILCQLLYDYDGCQPLPGQVRCDTWNKVVYQCIDATLSLEEYSKGQMDKLIEAATEFPDELLIERRFQGETNLSKHIFIFYFSIK